MRLFYITFASLLVVLIAISCSYYFSYKKAPTSTKLTKFYYYAIEANYLEPTSYNKKLSIKPNGIYPDMPQINKLDYIYE
jgi:hypothetical protein